MLLRRLLATFTSNNDNWSFCRKILNFLIRDILLRARHILLAPHTLIRSSYSPFERKLLPQAKNFRLPLRTKVDFVSCELQFEQIQRNKWKLHYNCSTNDCLQPETFKINFIYQRKLLTKGKYAEIK